MHYSWWNHGTYTRQSIHLAKTNIKWCEWFRSDVWFKNYFYFSFSFAFVEIHYSNQLGQIKHTCVKIWSWEHQQSFTIHLEDCENANFRKHTLIGCMGEELLWCSLCKFYHFLCLFGFLCNTNDGTMVHLHINQFILQRRTSNGVNGFSRMYSSGDMLIWSWYL